MPGNVNLVNFHKTDPNFVAVVINMFQSVESFLRVAADISTPNNPSFNPGRLNPGCLNLGCFPIKTQTFFYEIFNFKCSTQKFEIFMVVKSGLQKFVVEIPGFKILGLKKNQGWIFQRLVEKNSRVENFGVEMSCNLFENVSCGHGTKQEDNLHCAS